MKYLVTLVWSFILGQVVYYLGSSLTKAPYDLVGGTILSIVLAGAVVIVAHIMESVQQDTPEQSSTSK